MVPDIHDNASQNQPTDNDVEFVPVVSQVSPILSHDLPDPGQAQAPWKRSYEGIQKESPEVHSGDTRRKRNESANDRQETAYEDDNLTVTLEEPISSLQILERDQDILAIAFDERPASPHSGIVSYNRAPDAAQSPGQPDQPQVEDAGRDQKARERHDYFRRQRNAGALDSHQEDHTRVAHGRDCRNDPCGQNFNNACNHSPTVFRAGIYFRPPRTFQTAERGSRGDWI